MAYITVGQENSVDVELYYTDQGSGQPVVLIHGYPLNGESWGKQAGALLDAGYRVIAYDRRGFGASTKTSGGYDYDTFASDLNGLMDALDLQDAVLVGFSMGTGEVARYLSTYGSQRVAAAAFLGSLEPYLLKTDDNPDGVDYSVFQGMKDQVRKDRFAFLGTFAKAFYGVGWVSSPVSQELLDWTFVLGLMASPKATIDCIDAFGTTDFRPDLAAFTMPTLIIHGTADKTVPIDPTGRAAARGIPHAALIEYDGEPHGLFATAPQRLNEDLLRFLGA